MRIGFLGPEGTFSEAALKKYDASAEAVPFVDVPSALAAVRNGTVDASIVPIENSVEGGVNATLDSLGQDGGLVIVGETLLPITFTLSVRPEFEGEIILVGSHPHGWAQCRRTLHKLLPAAHHVVTASTAAAARALAEGTADFDAALSSQLSAEKYGLRIVQAGIADNPNAITRFVVVRRPGVLPEPTGSDKTTLQVHLGHNNAGGLLEVLEQFAVRGVNMSRIESRPIGDELGRYAFSIDAEGHIRESRMQELLVGLHRVCPEVRFIGSYPSADTKRPKLLHGTSDDDFTSARAWVSTLLDRGADVVGGSGSGAIAAPSSSHLEGDSRVRIIAAARMEFAAYGYNGASLRQMAAMAGVDPSLVPYHFGGKRELFQQVVLDYVNSPDALLAAIKDPLRLVRYVIGDSSGLDELPPKQLAAIAAIRTALTPNDEQRDDVSAQLADVMRDLISRVAEQVESPTASLAHVCMIIGILILRNICPVTPIASTSSSELIEYVTASLGLLQLEPILGPEDETPSEVHVVPADEAPLEGLEVLPARDRIFRSAQHYFAQRGYAGASLREIAALAECDISLIHYYFGSKFGLMEAVIDDALPSVPFQAFAELPDVASQAALGMRIINSIALDSSANMGFQALLRTMVSPGDAKVAELVRVRTQRLFDTLMRSSGRPDIDLGFNLIAAETLGAVVLEDFLAGFGVNLDDARQAALEFTLDAASKGLSIVQYVARAKE